MYKFRLRLWRDFTEAKSHEGKGALDGQERVLPPGYGGQGRARLCSALGSRRRCCRRVCGGSECIFVQDAPPRGRAGKVATVGGSNEMLTSNPTPADTCHSLCAEELRLVDDAVHVAV